jgi:hypothetical protein
MISASTKFRIQKTPALPAGFSPHIQKKRLVGFGRFFHPGIKSLAFQVGV